LGHTCEVGDCPLRCAYAAGEESTCGERFFEGGQRMFEMFAGRSGPPSLPLDSIERVFDIPAIHHTVPTDHDLRSLDHD
jgi:hypothetical protein